MASPPDIEAVVVNVPPSSFYRSLLEDRLAVPKMEAAAVARIGFSLGSARRAA
jgi:hypothetical protein